MDSAVLRTSHMVVGGDALARDPDGRVVFVSGALPGELVRVAIRSRKKDFAKADVVEVLEPSTDRVEPLCDAFRRGCGGCDWMHIDPATQLQFKAAMVREALARIGRLGDPTVVIGAAVAPWGYRTTARLAPAGDGSIGFRSRRSHDVIPTTRCPVAHPLLEALIATIDGRAARTDIVVRVSTTTSEASVSTARPAVVHETVAGRRLRVSPESFFQSSPYAAELLVECVGRLTADIRYADSTVLDAYGGVGLFAATVAAHARRLILIESSASSCADARVNLAGRSVTIAESRVEDWQPEPADLVIADPARRGLDRMAAATLAATGAPVIILVSCDAGSLGRDARVLTDLGYQHHRTEVLDVFPNTSHIEAVTRFGCERFL